MATLRSGDYLQLEFDVDNRQLRNLDKLTKTGQKKLMSFLARSNRLVAEAIVHDTQQDMRTGQKTGKVYDGIRASAPGETPAVREGVLVEGFHIQQYGHLGSNMVTITNPTEYAEILYGMERPIIKATAAHKAMMYESVRYAVKESLKAWGRKL